MISRLAGWWRTHRSAALAAAAVAGAVVIAAAFIWPITDLIAAHDVGRIAGPQRATQLQAAREAVRTQLLTLAAGVFVAGALWFTAQNFRLSREGQVTDRYTKAIEQVGSDTIDVTIGGIYALERVARDSARDHPTVMEVLAACIRENSFKNLRQSVPSEYEDRPAPAPALRADIQAALTVIGRRDTTHDSGLPIDLTGAYLVRAHLRGVHLAEAHLIGAHLAGAHLAEADLTEADLAGADLAGADLAGAHLAGAHLFSAILTEADLTEATLTEATLARADLTGADLTGADLAGATIHHADLTGVNLFEADLTGANLADAHLAGANLFFANLTSADLTEADLTEADLTGALYPNGTVPGGWARDPGTGRLERANGDPSDGPGSGQPGADAA